MCSSVLVCWGSGGGILLTCSLIGLFKRWGEGQPLTILSPAVGKSRETKREGESEGGQLCVLMLIFWSNWIPV